MCGKRSLTGAPAEECDQWSVDGSGRLEGLGRGVWAWVEVIGCALQLWPPPRMHLGAEIRVHTLGERGASALESAVVLARERQRALLLPGEHGLGEWLRGCGVLKVYGVWLRELSADDLELLRGAD